MGYAKIRCVRCRLEFLVNNFDALMENCDWPHFYYFKNVKALYRKVAPIRIDGKYPCWTPFKSTPDYIGKDEIVSIYYKKE